MARLTRDQRREQLLEVGAAMITESGFDAFSIDGLAARAEISRSLLFHYFASRQDFLVAVAERAAQEVLDITQTDPADPPPVQLLAGITGFLDYIADKGEQYVALVRGAAGGGAQMQDVFTRTRGQLADRLVAGAAAAATAPPPHLVHLAARGQIALAEEVIVGWLTAPDDDRQPREELVGFLAMSMVDVLRRAGLELDPELLAMLAHLDG